MKDEKNKILALMITATFLICLSVSNNSGNKNILPSLVLDGVEAVANPESGGGGVSCYCGKIYGKGCKADNSGSSCNPSGSSDCWSYDRNCS